MKKLAVLALGLTSVLSFTACGSSWKKVTPEEWDKAANENYKNPIAHARVKGTYRVTSSDQKIIPNSKINFDAKFTYLASDECYELDYGYELDEEIQDSITIASAVHVKATKVPTSFNFYVGNGYKVDGKFSDEDAEQKVLYVFNSDTWLTKFNVEMTTVDFGITVSFGIEYTVTYSK